jgi:hypothetical protein
MRRPAAAALAVVTAAALGAALPSEAAPKKKPKPITGSYTVNLPPDPTGNVDGQGCAGQVPISQDQHPFTIPAKGLLKLRLVSEDPSGQALDWDLALLDEGGSPMVMSTSPTATEEILMKFKRKEKVIFQACNLAGLPEATVSYTFTYS